MGKTTLRTIESFDITGEGGEIYHGGDQRWFSKEFRKEAACGATTCANILGYMARADEGLSGLADFDLKSKAGFLSFMEAVYPCVRPGFIGIMPADYTRGLDEFTSTGNFKCETETLTVPGSKQSRPTPGKVLRFIGDSLEKDIPVAFLNLSSGRVKNLEGYHWVTIAAIDEDGLIATIIDNSRRLEVNLDKWLKKTTLGGAFVRAEIQPVSKNRNHRED